MTRLRNLRNAEKATRTDPLLRASRQMALLQAHAATTTWGTKAAPARAFLVSRAYVELAQEACRDVMRESIKAEDILRLALRMLEDDAQSVLDELLERKCDA